MARNRNGNASATETADLPSIEEVSKQLSEFIEMQTEEDSKRAEAVAAIPKPKRYRVKNSGWVMDGGIKSAIRQGKIVTAGAYNLANLEAQGIILEELAEE